MDLSQEPDETDSSTPIPSAGISASVRIFNPASACSASISVSTCTVRGRPGRRSKKLSEKRAPSRLRKTSLARSRLQE